MLPVYYEYHNPVKINAGKNALETIPHELKVMNASRPLVITDQGIVNAGLLDIFLASFKGSGITIGAIYDKTPPDSSVVAVNEIATLFQQENCDSLIAIGGGSSIDTAKGVNIVVSEKDSDLRKFIGADRLTATQKPLVAIPTTSGTGSEVTLVSVILDAENGVKLPFTSRLLLPKLAVLDPRMTRSLPPRITAATGMDSVTHAIEAYTCLQKNPISDAYATAALKLAGKNLITATEKGSNVDARFAMANASLMAGTAFSNSMVGAVHAIGHACGSEAHVHHGNAMAILLPYVMKFNMSHVGNLYEELLLPFAGEEIYLSVKKEDRCKKMIEVVLLTNHHLQKICGMPVKLSQAGVDFSQLEKIAEVALDEGAMLPNPKELAYNDVLSILKEAF